MISARQMNWVTSPIGTRNINLTDWQLIETLIYRSALRGRYHITLSTATVSVDSYDTLWDLGYRITYESRDTGNFYNISWQREV